MASPTLKELKYRTFDDLLNEVYIDLPSFTREGMVEPGQLIKIAQKCNYELGLKIHGTKETMLEFEHGRAKLPSDFYILNLALLCGHYRTCEPGLFNGIHTEDVATPILNPDSVPQLTSCPCWKVENANDRIVQTKYTDCSGDSQDLTMQPHSIIYLCASVVIDPNHQLIITTDKFCYNIPKSGTFSCNLPEECCVISQPDDKCGVVNADPWKQNRVYTTCNGTMQVNVIEYHSNEVREYSEFERIRMVPSKEATAFCVNTQFQDAPYHGHIRDGFLWIPDAHHHHNHVTHQRRRVYICYLGAMEDADGNLIVLDHPKINEYYEWALKERILQNQYLNGEPDLLERWKVAKTELRTARAEALSIATTPDFYELKKTIEMNRRAMYNKYVHPFSSLWANTPGWPWANNSDFV